MGQNTTFSSVMSEKSPCAVLFQTSVLKNHTAEMSRIMVKGQNFPNYSTFKDTFDEYRLVEGVVYSNDERLLNQRTDA